MIEYLILLMLAKYRHGIQRAPEPVEFDEEWHLRPGAGIEWEPPPAPEKRPDLRIV